MKKNKYAVITGASSGIGAAFARHFAGEGYDLVITGRRKDLLHALAVELESTYSIRVEEIEVELTDSIQVEKLINKIMLIDNIEILVNNAGFGTNEYFYKGDIKKYTDMVMVHDIVPMILTYAVLPKMVLSGYSGIIINVSSLSALIPLPKNTVYGGSKAFLINFSESLSIELKDKDIYIQALCPGFTRTDFHKKLDIPEDDLKNTGPARWMTPEKVVKLSVRAVQKGKVVYIPGFWNKLLVLFTRIIPKSLFYKLAGRFFD